MVEKYQAETGCAALAERRGDLLVATAPPVERWLLIECREAWPRDALAALRHSPTDPEGNDHSPASERLSAAGSLGAEVARLCSVLRCRPVLIRRHGRVDRSTPRQWAMVDSRPGYEAVRWGELPSDEYLLDVLIGADTGTPSSEPVYLVCTHGRHDACCAVRGRPTAAALSAAYPDRTWECSHVGGDRFAANLVLLPHGLFYGHVPLSRTAELVRAYDAGEIVPDCFRGSGAMSSPVQAAQHFAREQGFSTAIDALRPVAVDHLAPDRWRVALDDHGRRVTVDVASRIITVDGQLTCSSKPSGTVRRFTLEGLSREARSR
ncbi:sucrase ferredoxin [Kribbella caucasensis]|uniref:sucrase ferredoxin n=1 Tax=Kribbella caucasensis TaxID=2512215 RepID=UPI0014152A47|nr:sucrase ferredoxin [Kribbella sp. VKM Ac-2527]